MENEDHNSEPIFFDSDSIEDKIAKFRESENVTIDDLKKMYELGVKFYNEYKLKEAEMVFISYYALNPYDHRGPGSLASIYLERKEFLKALDMLNVLNSFATSDLDETVLNISLCYYKLKDYKQAATTLLVVSSDNLSTFNKKRYDYLIQQLKPYLP